jgi:hypothetical protein
VRESVARVEDNEGLRARVAELEGLLSATTTQLAVVIAERDNLRRAYDPLKEHWELLQRRIFVAKAERIDTTQLEIEFAETKKKLDAIGPPPPGASACDRCRPAARSRPGASTSRGCCRYAP